MKKNKRFRWVLRVTVAIFFALALAGNGQVKDTLPFPFPEALLDGDAHFDVALHLQGDIRGNVGPCG